MTSLYRHITLQRKELIARRVHCFPGQLIKSCCLAVSANIKTKARIFKFRLDINQYPSSASHPDSADAIEITAYLCSHKDQSAQHKDSL